MRAIAGKLTLAFAPLLAGLPAAAQESAAPSASAPEEEAAPINGATRYRPADFARFAPRTALDMVEKIPGFVIATGSNGGSRGLGAATENLLIDGERIANKASDARATLSRLSAAQVAYIDIVDGASLDVPGLTGQVANVRLVAGSGAGRRFTTTLRWQPEWRPGLEDNWLRGDIATSGTIGGVGVTLALKNEATRQGHWGPEFVRDGAGLPLFVRQEHAAYDSDRPRLSAALSRAAANGDKWNANIGVQRQLINERIRGESIQPAAGRVRERFSSREDEWNIDVGGDYELGLGGGRLKLIGLYRFEHSPTLDIFRINRETGGESGERFRQTADESESILRGEYSWRTSGGSDWQVALEGAYNMLDIDAEFARLQPGGAFLPVVFGGEHVRVEEKRGEASLTWGRTLADGLTAQVNLGVEYSELASSGANGLTRHFVRPKGKAALAWKVGPRTTVNWHIQRRIDQLSFFDFASSVNLSNNNGNSGNTHLIPPVLNRTELELVRDMGRWGNASAAIAYAYAQDLVDQIPLSAISEGRGNLPPAHLFRVSGKATLLLDPVGWIGARINADVTFRRNRVRDPLINVWRDQSYGKEYVVDLSLRHDIPGTDIAWGSGYFDERESPNIRLDAVENGFTTAPFVSAFIEHKNIAGFTVKLSYRNLANMKDAFDRTVFVERRDGPVAFNESRRRRFGQFLQLTVTGTI